MKCRVSRVFAALVVSTVSVTAHAQWELLDSPIELLGADGAKATGEIGPPRCGTTGQLDDDGVLDLVTGHGLGETGAIVVYRGNPTFRQGLRRDLWRAEKGLPPLPAFEERAMVLGLPFAPQWLAIADLDGDGRPDIACAARGRNRLAVVSGTGGGGFAEPLLVPLPGPVTALATGDVNRGDATTDLVIAIEVGGGGALLVYEHPTGALHAEPELHHLAAPATDIAVGRLDEDPWTDIAAAAGDIVVVLGRDRRLADRTSKRLAVAPARTESLTLEAPAHDLELGRFVDGSTPQLAVWRADGVVELVQSTAGRLANQALGEIAPPTAGSPGLVAARGLAGPTDDLVVVDASGTVAVIGVSAAKTGARSLASRGVIDASARSVLVARLNQDARDDLLLLGGDVAPRVAKTMPRAVFTVNSTADTDDGVCNLSNCTLREALNAANAAPTASGIVMDLSYNAVIAPDDYLPLIQVSNLTIDGTVGAPPITARLQLDGDSCFDCSGLEIYGDLTTVTRIAFGKFRRDGATVRAALNITSDGNLIAGCLIGINSLGHSTPNDCGVVVSSGDSNTIGGSTAADRNVISANDTGGVILGGYGDNNRVIGNYIGTNLSGTASVGNYASGVSLRMTGQNYVGTALAGEGNVIAANAGYGIDLSLAAASSSSNAYVLHNLIGVAADGVTALINVEGGIHVDNQRNTTIGGVGAAPRNVVAALTGTDAIGVEGDSAGTVVRGNYVGIGSDGATAMPPARNGIVVTSSGVTVGGTVSGSGNVIGANDYRAVAIGAHENPVSDCDVLGNTIGTDVAQQTPLINGSSGVRLWSCSSCTVGDPAEPESGNTIVVVGTHNSTYGVSLYLCDDIQIAHNRIGETEAGVPMGGAGTGISVSDSVDSQIGWGNIIANNGGKGISVQNASSRIFMATNSIHSNDDIGIELGGDMVTPNDPGDTDTGPNNLQNYPVITGYNPGTGFVTATLDSDRPMATYMVQLYEVSVCDIFGNGEGERFLGAVNVMSDGTGDSSITMAATPTPGWFLTMLASDPDGNTSEFSECFEVPGDPDLIFADGFESGTTSAWSG